MHIRFYDDPATGLPHIYSHGVAEHEVVEVFENSPLRMGGKRGALFALGQTFAGRYLKVVYRDDGSGVFVITAYNLRGKELKAYRRRRRRRNR